MALVGRSAAERSVVRRTARTRSLRKLSTVPPVIDKSRIPEKFPTQLHDSAFWEWLGRTVATFGLLEETLGKAIFAFTATRPYSEAEIDQAYANWLPKLEIALTDSLGSLIDTYGKAVRDHPNRTIRNVEDLLVDLRKAAKLRNVLCHGSWRPPDVNGSSLPLFVNRQKEVFDTAIDVSFLMQVQRHAAELTCEVVSTVTHMGWQFPGSHGLGDPIWHDA